MEIDLKEKISANIISDGKITVPAHTLHDIVKKLPDGAEILIKPDGWGNPRRLTPNEAKYLMGFDDKYALCFGHSNGFPQLVSDTQAYKQFGNSVVPLVIEDIMQNIITEIVRYKLESKLNFI